MGGIWKFDDENEDGVHASLSYDDVASSGPAARPLDFPAPTVFRCENVDIRARDHRSGTIHHLKHVVMRGDKENGRPADTAYLVKKKLGKSVYGSVRLCIVLKRCSRSSDDKCKEERQDSTSDDTLKSDFVEWESTDFQAVIKVSEWSKIHAMRGRHLEDPIREISAMQLLGNYHPHVLGALEVLQDDNCLYTVMPYLSGGDLYGRLVDCCPRRRPSENPERETHGFDESQARVWFRQLLLVSDIQDPKFPALPLLILTNRNSAGTFPFAKERSMPS
jgi:serine/threonine protein kinase